MDTLTPEQRSRLMAGIRGKNTGPERFVRSMLHRMGLRFRLHRRDLPGSPDIVLPRHGAVVFVHGCYWHGHRKKGCSGGRLPKSNVEFWTAKIRGNAERDGRKVAALRRAGWRVLTAWECELRKPEGLERRLRRFLGVG